jgi:hypothetical protein
VIAPLSVTVAVPVLVMDREGWFGGQGIVVVTVLLDSGGIPSADTAAVFWTDGHEFGPAVTVIVTVALCVACSVPTLQLTFCAVGQVPGLLGLVNVTPVTVRAPDTLSLTVTLFAGPGPLFVTVTL